MDVALARRYTARRRDRIVTGAREVLQRLAAFGARIECRGERLVIRPGARAVPADLIAAARSIKPALRATLSAGAEGAQPAEDAQHRDDEHLRCIEAEKPRISAAPVEGAQVSAFAKRLGAKSSKMLTEHAQVSAFDKTEHSCGSQAGQPSKVLTHPSLSSFREDGHLRRKWDDAEEERAAIVERDGGTPRSWAEGFARLDPNRPPGDVPLKRWLRFVDDVGLFLDNPFYAVAAALGWGPLDLFGCDRDRPFARIDQAGLLWLLNGDRLIALTENTAGIETQTGARQTYRRKPNEPGRVLAWELGNTARSDADR
jgi:hypothetical protein